MNFLSRGNGLKHYLMAAIILFILTLLVVCPRLSLAEHPSTVGPLPAQIANGKIAFTSGNFLFTINADGSALLQLMTNGTNLSPAWSPDGTKIAFGRRGPQDSTFAIYVINGDGSSLQKISVNASGDSHPSWSPDGGKITFSTTRDGNSEIYVMNADGSNPINLTNNIAEDLMPEWSPDGTKIAFVSRRDFPGITGDVTKGDEVYVMNPDGSNPTRLTNNNFADANPSWSPDSTRIAFGTNRDGNFEIYVMNADGSNQTNLTNNSSSDFDPAWSPDGTRIAFLSFRDSVFNIPQEIYAMSSDGNNVTRITNSSLAEVNPDWQPLLTGPTPTPTPTPSPTPTPQGQIVISQIYSGGGQAGSTFQNNFIELFNRGNAPVDIGGWPLSFTSAGGAFSFSISFVSSNGVFIGPGKYLLIQLGPASANGAPLPVTPDFTTTQNIELSGKIALSRPGTFLTGTCPLPNSNIVDFVGFGSSASCFEGSGPTATLNNTTAALRLAGGCTDTDNNVSDFAVGSPAPRNSSSTANFCTSTPPEVRLSQNIFTSSEGVGSMSVMVNRTGNTSGASTVDYTTSDTSGTNNCNTISTVASARCDYLRTIGTLSFAAGETFKLISIPLIDDSYAEGTESFSISLNNPVGASLGPESTASISISDNEATNGPNPIDQTGFFVRQHYIDFLNREPDDAGRTFWVGEIDDCNPKPQCIEIKRINVSAAFFLSIEFQNTGYLAYRMYKAAYGDTTSPNVAIPVPIIRLHEFLPDAQRIGRDVKVGIGDWEAKLEANKQAYAREFVVRQRFLTAYPLTMTPAEFVDKLNVNAGSVLSSQERDQLINELTAATDVTQGRASVLRKVAEDADLRQRETTRAFVLMQYYGYLRRNPDDPQDTDFQGWEFWLNKLNQFNGNFVGAEMVKAFIGSIEYRQRFGP